MADEDEKPCHAGEDTPTPDQVTSRLAEQLALRAQQPASIGGPSPLTDVVSQRKAAKARAKRAAKERRADLPALPVADRTRPRSRRQRQQARAAEREATEDFFAPFTGAFDALDDATDISLWDDVPLARQVPSLLDLCVDKIVGRGNQIQLDTLRDEIPRDLLELLVVTMSHRRVRARARATYFGKTGRLVSGEKHYVAECERWRRRAENGDTVKDRWTRADEYPLAPFLAREMEEVNELTAAISIGTDDLHMSPRRVFYLALAPTLTKDWWHEAVAMVHWDRGDLLDAQAAMMAAAEAFPERSYQRVSYLCDCGLMNQQYGNHAAASRFYRMASESCDDKAMEGYALALAADALDSRGHSDSAAVLWKRVLISRCRETGPGYVAHLVQLHHADRIRMLYHLQAWARQHASFGGVPRVSSMVEYHTAKLFALAGIAQEARTVHQAVGLMSNSIDDYAFPFQSYIDAAARYGDAGVPLMLPAWRLDLTLPLLGRAEFGLHPDEFLTPFNAHDGLVGVSVSMSVQPCTKLLLFDPKTGQRVPRPRNLAMTPAVTQLGSDTTSVESVLLHQAGGSRIVLLCGNDTSYPELCYESLNEGVKALSIGKVVRRAYQAYADQVIASVTDGTAQADEEVAKKWQSMSSRLDSEPSPTLLLASELHRLIGYRDDQAKQVEKQLVQWSKRYRSRSSDLSEVQVFGNRAVVLFDRNDQCHGVIVMPTTSSAAFADPAVITFDGYIEAAESVMTARLNPLQFAPDVNVRYFPYCLSNNFAGQRLRGRKVYRDVYSTALIDLTTMTLAHRMDGYRSILCFDEYLLALRRFRDSPEEQGVLMLVLVNVRTGVVAHSRPIKEVLNIEEVSGDEYRSFVNRSYFFLVGRHHVLVSYSDEVPHTALLDRDTLADALSDLASHRAKLETPKASQPLHVTADQTLLIATFSTDVLFINITDPSAKLMRVLHLPFQPLHSVRLPDSTLLLTGEVVHGDAEADQHYADAVRITETGVIVGVMPNLAGVTAALYHPSARMILLRNARHVYGVPYHDAQVPPPLPTTTQDSATDNVHVES